MSEQEPADATPAPEDQQPIETETPDTDALGDKGKKALDAMKAQREAAKATAAAATARAEAAEAALAAKDKSAEEVALDAARREATEEATKAANLKLAKSALKLAAATKLVNPDDALAFIDVSSIDIDADGEADVEALNSKIEALLSTHPYLAAGKSNPFQGGGDGGAKSPSKPDATLAERADAALAAGDVRGSIALKTAQLKPIA